LLVQVIRKLRLAGEAESVADREIVLEEVFRDVAGVPDAQAQVRFSRSTSRSTSSTAACKGASILQLGAKGVCRNEPRRAHCAILGYQSQLPLLWGSKTH
jgi:hypothetical protein